MKKTETIAVWPECDPQLAAAIDAFSQSWGPYSAESRSHSIFRLMRELIDPAWNDLQVRFPGFQSSLMDRAWNDYQHERFGYEPEFFILEVETPAQRLDREKQASMPCAGKIHGKYVLSEFARHHGFAALERFLQLLCPGSEWSYFPPTQCFDSLRVLAQACRNKKSKKKMWGDGNDGGDVNARRAHRRPACRLCGAQTVLVAYLDGAKWPNEAKHHLRLSAFYCAVHRPKAPGSKLVRAKYFQAKRSQSEFDLELGRMERQLIGRRSMPWARSGNELVDRYILRFVAHHLHDSIDSDSKVRDEARKMVDIKITDRKKKIVMLLASGLNQSQAAEQLGITRQTVSKDLQSITDTHKGTYRLDLLPDRHT